MADLAEGADDGVDGEDANLDGFARDFAEG